MSAITQFNGANTASLADALLAAQSGIVISPGSVSLNASSATAVGTYDGTLAGLGIGAGIVLTSGTMPGTANTSTSFGQYNGGAGSALIDQVINPIFQTQSYDATTLSFDFTVSDPTATSVSFQIVFGSEEYPEWVDAFVDSAVVYVNGVNYALFNHDPNAPLSVISPNLAAGYFNDNASGSIAVQYDGVSNVLTIVAPINVGGTNTISIGISDTGDGILDSGIFLANLTAGNLPGSGVVIGTPGCTELDDSITGSDMSEVFDLIGGDDVAYGGGGGDILSGGSGKDSLFGGSGDDALKGGVGDDSLNGGAGQDEADFDGASTDYTISYDAAAGSYSITATVGGEGTDILTGVELVKFSNGTFQLTPGGLTEVTPPTLDTNSAGQVVITGIAAVGNTLSAHLSDADGVSGPVSYDWQTSTDGGLTWDSTGITDANFDLTGVDEGALIQVAVSYQDDAGNAEAVVSGDVSVAQTGDGDLVVNLIQLDAPAGASEMNPLTTLVARLMDIGLSPNMAALAVKSVLGIPASVNLNSYDPVAALTANPADATALLVEKLAVQVAVLTSLTDDDTGVNLALAIADAASAGQGLDLADLDTLATLTNCVAEIDPATNKYPQPLDEVQDRNGNLAEAATLADIQQEWADLVSINDGIAIADVADLQIHINQGPSGLADGALAAVEGAAVTLDAATLLQGYTDPEGGALAVQNLTADQPGTITEQQDGSFLFTPDAGVTGPVELSYQVADTAGATIAATKMLIVSAPPVGAPVIDAPITATAVEDAVYLTINPRANASDPEGDAISVVTPATLADGFVFKPVNQTFRFYAQSAAFQSLAAGETMDVVQHYTLTDGTNQTDGTITVTVTGANDVAVLGGTKTGSVTEDGTQTATGQLTVTDVDHDEAAFVATVTPLAGTYGTLSVDATGAWSYSLNNASAAVQALTSAQTVQDHFTLSSVDGTTVTLNLTVHGVDELGIVNGTAKADTLSGSTGNDTISGLAGNDKLSGADGDDRLVGGTGSDTMSGGDGDDSYQVDHELDRVKELSDQGHDTIETTLRSIKLAANVEDLTYLGSKSFAGNGNTLDNLITGGDGKDQLFGDTGADSLIGGDGNDQLTGGAGLDVLTGGDGRDSFVFKSASEMGDTITDFETGNDLMDLSGIDANSLHGKNQSFVFIGTADFGNVAGQLRYAVTEDGATVSGDVNGDGIGDFTLTLEDVTTLTAADFIL